MEEIFVNGIGASGPGGGERTPAELAREMGDIVGDILKRLGAHGVIMRSDIAASLITISNSEALIMQLNPEFPMLERSLPYFVK